jgi:hypothetical protein
VDGVARWRGRQRYRWAGLEDAGRSTERRCEVDARGGRSLVIPLSRYRSPFENRVG